ncbi:MAG TPA: hypothetical protein PKB14_08225 [Rubrivivax sp.]|nr:hypothetical protein [Rubrivivax sp.]
MRHEPDAQSGGAGLQRRDILKLGLGFSLALTAGTALVGCSDAAKAPVQGFSFLNSGDAELFKALAPAVVTELAHFDAAKRRRSIDETLRNIDGTLAAMDMGSRKEVRKLLDLLAIAPLRYVLTGVGAWHEAGADKMQAFLARWRGSRFATLNAGGNVLVKLVASSFYVLPQSWPSTGYPGPLDYMFKAVNS